MSELVELYLRRFLGGGTETHGVVDSCLWL